MFNKSQAELEKCVVMKLNCDKCVFVIPRFGNVLTH